uniref:Uncharacterized protein n=1 Tax=Zea mays TaxID=4577 RepID=C4J1F1_MAIZE|nr:unknown [Zea mays]
MYIQQVQLIRGNINSSIVSNSPITMHDDGMPSHNIISASAFACMLFTAT